MGFYSHLKVRSKFIFASGTEQTFEALFINFLLCYIPIPVFCTFVHRLSSLYLVLCNVSTHFNEE